MEPDIIIALLSLVGTAMGTLAGILTANKMTTYRIEQLEKKVEKHNKVVERTIVLEEDMKTAVANIEELKKDVRELRKDDSCEN